MNEIKDMGYCNKRNVDKEEMKRNNHIGRKRANKNIS